VLEGPKCTIISEPISIKLDSYTELCFLPYITECDRKAISEYFPDRALNSKRIILSHNDIKGISYGPVVSTFGFDIIDIEASCDLYINAHIHNGQYITDKVLNIGNITGQNFSEDAFKYSHNIIILDTDTLRLTFIENPYAYNFYKLQIDCKEDIQKLEQLKNNAVVSIKCEQSLIEKVKQKIEETDNIIESRIILVKHYEESTGEATEMDLTVDHLARFIECCKATLENSTLLEEELSEICK
jgi:hypothetical protein